jgi:hypothetical protein
MSRPRSRPARNRRAFLRAAGIAGLAAAAAPAEALAAAAAPRKAKAPPPPKPAAPGESPISDDAKALAAVLQRRYGAHLSREQLDALTRDLDRSIQSGTRLRAVKLANADEPDTTFGA